MPTTTTPAPAFVRYFRNPEKPRQLLRASAPTALFWELAGVQHLTEDGDWVAFPGTYYLGVGRELAPGFMPGEADDENLNLLMDADAWQIFDIAPGEDTAGPTLAEDYGDYFEQTLPVRLQPAGRAQTMYDTQQSESCYRFLEMLGPPAAEGMLHENGRATILLGWEVADNDIQDLDAA